MKYKYLLDLINTKYNIIKKYTDKHQPYFMINNPKREALIIKLEDKLVYEYRPLLMWLKSIVKEGN